MQEQIKDAIKRIEWLSSIVPYTVPTIDSAWRVIAETEGVTLTSAGELRKGDFPRVPTFKAGRLRSAIAGECTAASRVAKACDRLTEMLVEPPLHATDLAIKLAKASRGTDRKVDSILRSRTFPSATASAVFISQAMLSELLNCSGYREQFPIHRMERSYDEPLHLNAKFWSELVAVVTFRADLAFLMRWGKRAATTVVEFDGDRGTWAEKELEIQAVFADAGDELTDVLEQLGPPETGTRKRKSRDPQKQVPDETPIETLKRIARELHDEGLTRPQIRKRLRGEHAHVIREYSATKAEDTNYPSPATISNWLQEDDSKT